jgi:hypothetical protein
MKRAMMILGLGWILALSSHAETVIGNLLSLTGDPYVTNLLFTPLSTPPAGLPRHQPCGEPSYQRDGGLRRIVLSAPPGRQLPGHDWKHI